MKKLLLAAVLLLILTTAPAQNTSTWLAKTLGSADTVWLISHRDLPRSGSNPFLINGRLNPAIVLRQKKLTVSI
jgi:hypothetical protein